MDEVGHGGLWRVLASAAVVGIALLVVACSGGGSSPSPAADAVYQKALRYTQCMRTHGIPNYPDPKVDRTGDHFHPPGNLNSPALQAAMQACRKSLPKFWSESGA